MGNELQRISSYLQDDSNELYWITRFLLNAAYGFMFLSLCIDSVLEIFGCDYDRVLIGEILLVIVSIVVTVDMLHIWLSGGD